MVINKINSEMSKKVEQQKTGVDLGDVVSFLNLTPGADELDAQLMPYIGAARAYDDTYGTNSLDILCYARSLYVMSNWSEENKGSLPHELEIPLHYMKGILNIKVKRIRGLSKKKAVYDNYKAGMDIIEEYARKLVE